MRNTWLIGGARRLFIPMGVIVAHMGAFVLLWQYWYMNPLPNLRTVIDIEIIEPQTVTMIADAELLPKTRDPAEQRNIAPKRPPTAPPSVVDTAPPPVQAGMEVLADETLSPQDMPDIGAALPPDLEMPAEIPNEDRLATFAALVNCQNIARRQDVACRDFVADLDTRRAMSVEPPITPPQLELRFAHQNRAEYLLSQNKRTPYLMPGMDGDLFTEGLPPGAYNAQRIRNGESPIWSRELERKLKGED